MSRNGPGGWELAVDFGTTATTAAIVRGDDVELVRFGATTRMPSGVFVDPTEGLLAATVALNRGGADPGRYVRTPKRHIGRDDEVLVGGQEIGVRTLVATVLGMVMREGQHQAGGSAPSRVVLTHPAKWGSRARDVLIAAAADAGMGPVTLVPEPVAAGQEAATAAASGARIAVYDLGGGTFDAVVLDRTDGDTWVVAGRPGGIDPFGGEAIDALLHGHLLARVAELDAEAARVIDDPRTAAERGLARTWWRDLRAGKEDLSESTSCSLWIPGTDHAILVSREELEDLVERPIADTVDELARTIRTAPGAEREITEILLCGDASRMPIVDRLVRAHFEGTPVRHAEDPKGVVARGAVPAARLAVERHPAPIPVPSRPTPPETSLPGWEAEPARQGLQTLVALPLPQTSPDVVRSPDLGSGPVVAEPAPDTEPAERVGGRKRRWPLLAGVAAAVLVLAAVGAGVVLSRQGGSQPPDPPESGLAALSARFKVSASDPGCSGDEAVPAITCTTADPDSGREVTEQFRALPTAAEAKAAYDARVAELGAAGDLHLSPTGYHADPANRTGSPTGSVTISTDDAGDSVILAQSDRYLAEYRSSEFDTVERAFIDTELTGAVDINGVFGSSIKLSELAACWPNYAMLLTDRDPVDVDCFSTTPGGTDDEAEVRLLQVPSYENARERIGQMAANSGGTTIKDEEWRQTEGGPLLGPYVVVDKGRQASPRYELYWAADAAPNVVMIASANNLDQLEEFWRSL